MIKYKFGGVWNCLEVFPKLNLEISQSEFESYEVYKTPVLDENGNFQSWQDDEQKKAEWESEQIRAARDPILNASDKFMLPDFYENFTEAQKTEIKAYRQSLRDAPESGEIPEFPNFLDA